MKKTLLLLFAATILAIPIVSATTTFPLFCVQKIKYDPTYGGAPNGAWVGTLRIPGSPSGKYDIDQWADSDPVWIGPPAYFGKSEVLFPGSLEIFHETWDLKDDDGTILASGYDKGYFDIEKRIWVVFGEVTWVLPDGELEYLADLDLRVRGRVNFIKGVFSGSGLWKFWDGPPLPPPPPEP